MTIPRRMPLPAASQDDGCAPRGQRPESGRCSIEKSRIKASLTAGWHKHVRYQDGWRREARFRAALPRAKVTGTQDRAMPAPQTRSAGRFLSSPSYPGRKSASILRLVFCRLAWAAALIVLPAFIAASAQTQAPTYEKNTETNIKGTVRQITVDANGMVHLAVRGRRESYDVLLGPQRFMKFLGIIYEKGEKVEVIGSRVTVDGAKLLLARTVRRKEDEIRFRDKQGNPAWNHWIE